MQNYNHLRDDDATIIEACKARKKKIAERNVRLRVEMLQYAMRDSLRYGNHV